MARACARDRLTALTGHALRCADQRGYLAFLHVRFKHSLAFAGLVGATARPCPSHPRASSCLKYRSGRKVTLRVTWCRIARF